MAISMQSHAFMTGIAPQVRNQGFTKLVSCMMYAYCYVYYAFSSRCISYADDL